MDRLLGQLVQQIKKYTVGPAKANHIWLVPGGHLNIRRPSGAIVLLANRAVTPEISRHHGKELLGDSVGIGGEAVAPETFHGKQLYRRPCVGAVRLHACGAQAHHQPAGLLKSAKVFPDSACLLGGGQASPKWVKRGDIFVGGAHWFLEIVVKEKAALSIPQIFLNPCFAILCPL